MSILDFTNSSKLGLFLIACALSSCVSSSTHRDSLKKIEELEAVLKDEKFRVESLQGEQKRLSEQLSVTEEKLISTAKDRGQLKSSLEEMKQAMEEMRARQAEQKKQLEEFDRLSQRLKSLTDAGTLTVKWVDGKMVVSLGSDILFPSGSAKLSAAGLEAIKEVAKQLSQIEGKRYQVEGHTDTVPISSAVFPSNWELASARAITVVKQMIDSGLQPERVSAASYSQYQPLGSNETPEGRASNRRIAIVVVPDLSKLE